MADPDKLPLLKSGLRMLVSQLDHRDRIAIVVYAGRSGLWLPSTRGDRKRAILSALDELEAGGLTNGAEGIELAYAIAAEAFVPGGVNRVLLATDGDFNVGVTDREGLVRLIQEKAKTGVFLSALGFGRGNLKDQVLENLADKGNGHYAYIDDADEAHRVLVEQAFRTLITVGKDVKLQLELNPSEVQSFRLLGYEDRMLAHPDFNDDRKDAGEIGAGGTVTAFYELVPVGAPAPAAARGPLEYQQPAPPPADDLQRGELLTVKLRYKDPDGTASRSLEVAVPAPKGSLDIADASADFRFGAAVVELGMLLRDSPYRGDASYAQVIDLAESALGSGPKRSEREELVELARKAAALARNHDSSF
jgi:Ca-activated chloride channel family protein